MAESIQKKLIRVRPPRVRITYDVEIGDAIIKKELPFVLGIMADLSGTKGAGRLPVYKERAFVSIDRDNFDAVLKDAKPELELSTNARASLKFESLADFTPQKLVKQVEPLRNLFQARNRLQDLAAKMDSSDPLHDRVLALLAAPDAERKKALEGLEAERQRLAELAALCRKELELPEAGAGEAEIPGITVRAAPADKAPANKKAGPEKKEEAPDKPEENDGAVTHSDEEHDEGGKQ